jgi:hypothetical protein
VNSGGVFGEFVRCEEGIVDVRIDRVPLVDVDHVCAGLPDLCGVGEAAHVMVAIAPLRYRVQQVKRCDAKVEVKVKR